MTKAIPNLPMGLTGLQGTQIPNGDLLLFCGRYSPEDIRYGRCHEYLLLKDGYDQWKTVGTMKTGRTKHSLVFMDGYLFTSGGFGASSICSTHTAYHVHEESLFQRDVKEKKDMPKSLYGHTATIFGPQKILISGGRDANVSRAIN